MQKWGSWLPPQALGLAQFAPDRRRENHQRWRRTSKYVYRYLHRRNYH